MPFERGKDTIVTAAGVVPIYAERMHMASRGLGQSEARVGPMQVIVNVEWLVRICSAPNAFCRLIQNAWDRKGKFHSSLFNLDRAGLDASEGADEGGKPLHRTARPAGENGCQRI